MICFLCLCSGVRTFVPKPVATTLQYIGGAAAILGLVAMASDVEGLYAAVKALVCVVKSNPLASKERKESKVIRYVRNVLKQTRLMNCTSLFVLTVPIEISCCVVTRVSLLKFLELLVN